jgi:hypothetical protein
VYDGDWLEDAKNGWATVTELDSGKVFRTFWRKGQEERSSRRSLAEIGVGSRVSESKRGSSSSSSPSPGGGGGEAVAAAEPGDGEGAASAAAGEGGRLSSSSKVMSSKDLEYKIMSLFTEFCRYACNLYKRQTFVH